MPNYKILLVDDEVDFLAPLRKRLAKRGFTVEEAHSGEAGLEVLAGYEADVVVLDVKMPGMDGIATLHKIKESWPLVEVIMLTGHASMEAAIRGMELGAFDYLMKPVDFTELCHKLEDAAIRKAYMDDKIRQGSQGL